MNNFCQRLADVHQVLGIHDLKQNQEVSLEQRLKDLESGASVSKIQIWFLIHFLTQITFRI